MRVTAATRLATRQRILDAARRLFAQEGFEAATTRDIARLAEIAAGTLFNYFPTKESIVASLASEAHAHATEAFRQEASAAERGATLEEDLFAHVAAGLRRLKPYRKYLPVVLETALSTAADEAGETPSLRMAHLETVSAIVTRHGRHEALSSLALQLYWTLYAGVLAYWAQDASPRQEATLALLDQSLAMFVGWLNRQQDESDLHTKGA